SAWRLFRCASTPDCPSPVPILVVFRQRSLLAGVSNMKSRLSSLAILGLAISCPQARAGLIDTIVANGTDNTYEDISRDHVFFNGNTNLAPGSDVVGFSQIEKQTSPVGTDMNNTLYVVFAQRIAAVGAFSRGGFANEADFGPVPAASPNSLQSIL